MTYYKAIDNVTTCYYGKIDKNGLFWGFMFCGNNYTISFRKGRWWDILPIEIPEYNVPCAFLKYIESNVWLLDVNKNGVWKI